MLPFKQHLQWRISIHARFRGVLLRLMASRSLPGEGPRFLVIVRLRSFLLKVRSGSSGSAIVLRRSNFRSRLRSFQASPLSVQQASTSCPSPRRRFAWPRVGDVRIRGDLALLGLSCTPGRGRSACRRFSSVRRSRLQDLQEINVWSPCTSNSHGRGRERCIMLSALPETAVSIVVAAVAVGASATMLRRMTEASSKKDSPTETCKDCEGSGLCTVCNGEGFVLKQLSEEKAEKARLTAKNMATRYTAGLPKKWSYCYKCSSTRSCRTCGGSGQVPI